MGDLQLFSTPVKRKRQPSEEAPQQLPATPVLPSPDVSPVQHVTPHTERRYREKRWRSEETPPRHDPSLVLLSEESQVQSAPDDTDSSYQDESTLTLDDLTLDDSFEG